MKGGETKNFLNLGIVFNKAGKVLLIRRVEKEQGSDGSILEWAFPGGVQLPGEGRVECVKREVLEETGYAIESIKTTLSMRHHPQFPVIIAYHLCRLVHPKPIAEPQEPYEIAEIRWVRPKEVKNLFTTNLDPDVARELNLMHSK